MFRPFSVTRRHIDFLFNREETVMDWHVRVWSDPGRCGGAPCVYGTRIPVDALRGFTADEAAHFYPSIRDMIRRR